MKQNHYHIRNRKPKNRQNDWAIAVFIDGANWARRSKDHRGATIDTQVGSRPMTDEEIKEYEQDYRLCFWRYFDWDTFVNDELKYLHPDHPFIAEVNEWRKTYRNIPDKPNAQLTMSIDNE